MAQSSTGEQNVEQGSADGSVVKNPLANARDMDLIHGPERFQHAVGETRPCTAIEPVL